MNGRRWRVQGLLPWIVVLCVAGAALPASGEMEVYHPKYRTGQDLEPMVQTVLGAEGRVAVDPHTGALILIGSTEGIAQALALLAIQDRRLRTVQIHHETRSVHDLEAQGLEIVWSAGGGSLRVGNVARPGGSGATVKIYDASRSGEGAHAGMVSVLEGEWGRIAEGSEMLVPTGSWRYPDAVRVSAESGLEVRPRILGDGRVRLDLRPFQARLDRSGAVAHSGAETTLVVTPGETAVVGSIGGAGSSDAGSPLGGVARTAGRRERLLLVTVALQEAGEPGR